jgi:malate synthase
MARHLPAGVEIVGPSVAGDDVVLTPAALAVVADLQRRFGPERAALLDARHARARDLAAGALPDFLAETAAVRAADWLVAPAPAALEDRRVGSPSWPSRR